MPPDDRARYWSERGRTAQNLYERTGDAAGLDEGISCFRSASQALPSAEAGRAPYLQLLMVALQQRFTENHDAADLDEAITAGREAIALSRTDTGCLAALGDALLKRFATGGDAADLEESITFIRRALSLPPARSWDGEASLSSLGDALAARSRLFGSVADMEESISLKRTALAVSNRGMQRKHALNLLSQSLVWLFELTGQPEVLAESVSLARRAVKAKPREGPDQALFVNNLGNLLLVRSRQLGSTTDIDEAVARLRDALNDDESGPARRTAQMSSLALLLLARYQRTHDASDLEEAVTCARAAVDATIRKSDEASHLSSLSTALVARFELRQDDADLDEGIELASRAALLTSQRGDAGARYHSALAHALRLRFEHRKVAADLEAAITAGRTCIAQTPQHDPERTGYLRVLAAALHARYELREDSRDRDEAVAAHVEAAAVPTAPASLRVSCARTAARALAAASDIPGAVDLLTAAVRLLPEVSPRRLIRGDQQYELRVAAGLASEAASLVLADPRLPEDRRAREALSLLEAGRAVLMSQALAGRDDLTVLHGLHPELAARYTELRDQLDAPGDDRVPVVQRGFDRQEMAAEFASLLARVRELDGLAAFGLPPAADDLIAAARQGPVAVLNVSAYGSHGLLVTRDGVRALALDGLDRDALRAKVEAFLTARRSVVTGRDGEQRRQGGAGITAVLEWLWEMVTGPVLDALGFRGRPPAGTEWPRVWWVPCGLFSMLPVHAAGYHAAAFGNPVPDTVIDRVVSSYTPSLRALLYSLQRPSVSRPAGTGRVLAVAMPVTPGLPGQGRLPNVPGEIAALRRHFPGLTVLGGTADDSGQETGSGEAVKSSVLDLLPGHPIAHFACHGQTVRHDPSLSQLLLRDHERDPFTAASLSAVTLDEAQLAYLSACSTASALNPGLIDESIHLASAFQIAGYPHVISTLWEIDDRLSVGIADRFYAQLHAGNGMVDAQRAAWALHDAVSTARTAPDGEGTIRNPFLWASYIHMGA